MKKLTVLFAVAAWLAATASAQAAPVPVSGCKLVKVTYWTQIERGQPYLYLQGFSFRTAGCQPFYSWSVDAPMPLAKKWHGQAFTMQYQRNAGVRSVQKFRIFYAKNKLGKLVPAGAGVTITFGSSQDDVQAGVRRSYYRTCSFQVKRSKGIINSPKCSRGFEQDAVLPSEPSL